jgi:excisionase family DNA binding protein
MKTHETDPLMTTMQVAALFLVDPKTVTRWAKEGRLTFVRTLGGHRRYFRDEVNRTFQETIRMRSCRAPR